MKKIVFQKEAINIDTVIKEAGTDADGSVLTFIGRARNNSNGKDVTHLEYEIYNEMARKETDKIISAAMDKWPINSCIVIHRYGRIEIGEATIIIAVSSPHRDESFQATRYIIDTIKQSVPIWKKEFYSDGSEWTTERS